MKFESLSETVPALGYHVALAFCGTNLHSVILILLSKRLMLLKREAINPT